MYEAGNEVLVRLRGKKREKKSKSVRSAAYKGTVVKANHNSHTYTIAYEKDGVSKTSQFSVADITSVSVAKEHRRVKSLVPVPYPSKKSNPKKIKRPWGKTAHKSLNDIMFKVKWDSYL